MPYKVTRTTTRPSVNDEYFQYPTWFINQWIENGSILSTEKTDSTDGLTFTRVTTWKTEEDYNKFASHATTVSLNKQRDDHNTENGLTTVLEFANI